MRKYYYTQKTVYGYISELGGKSLYSKTKHILIDGYPHRIYISSDLDLKLKPFYRTNKLAVRLRVKQTFDNGNIVNAEMINFKTVGSSSLSENLKAEGFIAKKSKQSI